MVGFPQSYNDFVTARIRGSGQIGGRAGQSWRKKSVHANVLIIVTTEPQAMLNDIRANHSNLLGYYSTQSAGDRLAKVNHPIQASV